MNYFEIYKTIWNFHKKYAAEIENTEQYWETVTNEARTILKQNDKNKFVKDLLISVIDELERKTKENEGTQMCTSYKKEVLHK